MGMETVMVKYAMLFKLDVWLHHLLDLDGTLYDDLTPNVKVLQLGKYRLGEWMDIKPTETTKAAMAGLGWSFKVTSTGFLVVAAADSDDASKIAILPPENLVLEFEMVANKADFGQFSAFPLPGKINGQRAFYVFDSAATIIENATAYPTLALRPPAFSNVETYVPGTMVRNGNARFVAKVKTTGVATSNTNNWLPVTESLPYASASQLDSGEELSISPNAFGLVRIHCGSSFGNFNLLNGQNLLTKEFKIRLRNHLII